ncbi:MAG: metal ABC transporter substrate-binding protein [Lachnospiraceae bacterium]|nr:metal ABC transporter substrate-binding protein [Lachnospiraceae bacterium]MDE7273766.1 metal ABC transporter substrate-binding protein [Lachnospiraceae bacterium]
MKKSFMLVMLAALYLCILTGCTRFSLPLTEDNRLQIVCTTFPQYDWVVNLIQGNEANVSVTLLMDKGGDLHNFQPSALDMARVSTCDLLIYVGGESDVWVDDALKEAVNPDMRAMNMMEVVGERLVEEEHIEGVSGHGAHDHGENEEHEYDEHVWLSVRNAAFIVEEITAELARMDSENAELYRRNCDGYIEALDALDTQFAEAVKTGSHSTLLFADRFPFRYFVEDYGLEYYAAFNGCSAETEASFGTVAFLINQLDALALDVVVILEGSDDRLAQVVIENGKTGHQQIVVLNSMQSVSQKDIEAGFHYLNAMEQNLKVLRQALK